MTPDGETTRPDVGRVSTGDLLEKVGNLSARLDRAQQEIERLQTSDRSWVKKTGLIIGVLAGIVAIPKTVTETVKAMYHPARTSVEWGKPLDMRYDMHDHVLQLNFPVLANNEGESSDSIEEISAKMWPELDPKNFVLLANSDVQIWEQGKSVPQPIPIQFQAPRSLVVNLSVNPPFSEQALGFQGRRRMEVIFKTHSKTRITQEYCFDFDKEQGQEVLTAREMHLWTPFCE